MKIKQVELFHLRLPLNFMFKTAQASLNSRETLVLKVIDERGNAGYGEVVAFNEPFYCGETLAEAKEVLFRRYIPTLMDSEPDHPFEIHHAMELTYPMAEAGLENALLDLYARREQLQVMDVVFNEPTREQIKAGMALGDLEVEDLIRQIGAYRDEGYERFKIKIKPADGWAKLKAVRAAYPDLILLADANMSYDRSQTDQLKRLDQFNLCCIEEPLPAGDFLAYQALQAAINTPVCLDESIQRVDDLKTAIRLRALKVLNIKVGRVGGMYYAKQMIDLCREHGIGYWIGSMVESGISKILHVHLSSLNDTYIPGDLSPSRRYFPHDVILPEITADQGMINVPRGIGSGVEVDERALKEFTIDYIKLGGGENGSDRSAEH